MKLKSVILVLASVGALVVQAGEKLIKNGDTLVFMGDSITKFGNDHVYGYLHLVVNGLAANGINVNYLGKGISGQTAVQMKDRFQSDVVNNHPQVVTIFGGVNDCGSNWPTNTSSTPDDVAAMADMAIEAGITPVLLSPTGVNGENFRQNVCDYAAAVKSIAEARNVPYAATYEAYRAYIDDPTTPKIIGQYKISADGTHMSLIGDRLLAREVLKAFGLDATEIARAEAAWNTIPGVSDFHPSVKVTEGEYKAVKVAAARAGKPLNEYLKDLALQGCEQVSQAPATVAATSGASVDLSVTTPVTYVQYDQMIACGRALPNHDAVPTVVNYAMLSAVHALPAVTDADLPTEPVQTVNASAFAKSVELTCSGYAGSSTLQDFPVAVRLAAGTPAGFSYADMKNSAKGDELRFADSTGRSLSYEIETWDPAGASLVWVKVPSLAKNTKFKMYYGGTVSGAVQADWTWRAGDYVGVWHMAEASGKVSDSVNGLTAEPRGANASKFQAADAGVFGKGRVNSSNSGTYQGQSMLYVEDSTILDLGSDFTFSGWVKMTALSANSLGRIVSRNRGGGYGPDWELRLSDYTTLNGFAGSNTAVSGTIPSAQNTWVYIAGVFNGTTLTTYANGVKVFEQTIAAVADSDNKLVFGAKDASCVDGHFVGIFDEFRLRDAVSSADWVKAEYDQSQTTFLSMGAASSVSGESEDSGDDDPGEVNPPQDDPAEDDPGEVNPPQDDPADDDDDDDPPADPSGAITASADATGATDTAAIQAAIDACVATKGTVTLGSGTFYLNAQLCVTGGVTLAGQGYKFTVLKQVMSGGERRVVVLGGGATLSGVTVTGGNVTTGWKHGAGVSVEDGTVSWCCISNNTISAANGYGAGVFFKKGAIDHSIVSGNRISGSGYGAGIAAYQPEGAITIDTCLICGNRSEGGDKGGAGIGMYVGFQKHTVTVRNTTIVDNVADNSGDQAKGAAVCLTGNNQSKLVMSDCLVSGNASKGLAADLNFEYTNKLEIDYCLFDKTADKIGANSKSGDPKLTDGYKLGAASPAIGAGVTYSGIGTDLAGVAFANPPSMGCYEYGGSGPDPLEPLELGDVATRPLTDYNGNTITVQVSGDFPTDEVASAKVTIAGTDYTGTVDTENGSIAFTLSDAVVTAGNVYEGTITLTVGKEILTKSVTLAQGTLVVDEEADWIRESASSFGTTGAWSGDKAVVASGKISVSNAVFTAAKSARQDAVVTIASTFSFGEPSTESFDLSKRAGVMVVRAGGVNRYAVLTADGAVTNLAVVAVTVTSVAVVVELDNANHKVSYTVGGVKLGTYAMTAKTEGLATVRYVGATDVVSLDGAYRFEGLDANLAKAGDREYATVAEALAAGKGAAELLWDASWNPTAAGDYLVTKNGHSLEIGGSFAYSVKDNGNGTITVSVTGGETSVPEAAGITFEGSTLKVGVANAKAGLWYALEKTTDLTQPFVVDETTWVKGSDLIAGTKALSAAIKSAEGSAFYRVVVSTSAP